MNLYIGTPPTFAAGDNATVVANLNLLRDALKGLSEPWTAYVPTYGGITAIGNAVVAAAYHRVDKWIEGQVKIVMGSTTTYSGTFTVSLPVAVHADYASNCNVGGAFFLDNSVGSASRTGGHVVTSTSTAVFFSPGGSPGGTVTNTVPWTWATSDTLSFNFRYPAA